MLNVGNAYARALAGAGSAPTPASLAAILSPLPDEGPSAGALPRIPPMVDPRSQKGDIYFLDPSLVPADWAPLKRGDTVILKCSVATSGGSKIGLSVDEVLGEDAVDGGGDDFDTGGQADDSRSSDSAGDPGDRDVA